MTRALLKEQIWRLFHPVLDTLEKHGEEKLLAFNLGSVFSFSFPSAGFHVHFPSLSSLTHPVVLYLFAATHLSVSLKVSIKKKGKKKLDLYVFSWL